jgi:pyruvate formate-lyase activating enzyme-like uncharacterized protein
MPPKKKAPVIAAPVRKSTGCRYCVKPSSIVLVGICDDCYYIECIVKQETARVKTILKALEHGKK